PGTPSAPELRPLGDLSLAINSGPGGFNFDTDDTGDWGDAGFDWAIALDTFPGIADDVNVTGVAFDVEDFVGTTAFPVEGIRGLRITGTGVGSGRGSIDLGVSGYNANAIVPEPATLGLLALGGVVMLRRRA
ncbi:MAG: PEP-CTERM sorting domain-containing protein, partial [Planctomycetota bacterium]